MDDLPVEDEGFVYQNFSVYQQQVVAASLSRLLGSIFSTQKWQTMT